MSTSAVGARKLIFFGAPGVGKGTFASRIGPELGIPAISTGDIIRAEVKAGSDVGKEVKVSCVAARAVGGRRGSPSYPSDPQRPGKCLSDSPVTARALCLHVQAFSESGKLVPDELVDKMVKRRLAEPDAQNGYILVRRRTPSTPTLASHLCAPPAAWRPAGQRGRSQCACLSPLCRVRPSAVALARQREFRRP